MSDILWQPSAERIGKTRMEAFRRFINQRHHLKIDDYPACTNGPSISGRRSGRLSSMSSTSVFTNNPTRCCVKARACPAPSGSPAQH